MEVLKTNCGITGERKRKQTKRGKKVIPGKRVLNASESEEENDENVPCSSSRKTQQEKGGAKKSESIDDTDDEDVWRCRECGGEWDDNSSDRWIVCDI